MDETDETLRVAHAQRKAGDFSRAIEGYEQALRFAQATGQLDQEWMARTFLALSLKQLGKSQRVLQLREENLAFVRQHLEDADFAAVSRETDSLQALASDYTSLGNLEKAAELLNEALTLASRDTESFGLGRAKLTQKLGIIQFLTGDLATAERTLSTSLSAFEAARKARLAAGMPASGEYEMQVEVIRWLQRVAVDQDRTEDALELAERGRSRAFAGLLSGTEEQLPFTLIELKQIAAAENSTLVEYSILYDYDPDLPLEFSDYSKIPTTDLLIWLIKPAGEVFLRQVKLDPPRLLIDLVRGARQAIGAGGRGTAPRVRRDSPSDVPQLRRLHELLIQPIADLLPADPAARVTFLPQDLLFLVPFAALPDDAGRFLIERHTVTTAPSIRVLGLTRKQHDNLPEANTSALVIGNPTMPALGSVTLPALPGAEEEARAVAALLKAPVLTGDQATKKAAVARMPHARLIHLATHGLLDEVGSEFNSIALASADGDGGFLTAREILALALNAELVVLSACDTGLGRITGDGVVGLSRALIGAGASSVLVSLWSVPDAPTSALMSRFYSALERGADKAQALRQAMLATMEDYPSPVDWAAFTLVGDPRVSQTLRAAIASGMGSGDETGVPTRYQVFPVPAGIDDYREWPSRDDSADVAISFGTGLTLDELMTFYRDALAKDGLHEERDLTQGDAKGFSLSFQGSRNDRRLVVQGTDLRDVGSTDRRVVSVRFERG